MCGREWLGLVSHRPLTFCCGSYWWELTGFSVTQLTHLQDLMQAMASSFGFELSLNVPFTIGHVSANCD